MAHLRDFIFKNFKYIIMIFINSTYDKQQQTKKMKIELLLKSNSNYLIHDIFVVFLFTLAGIILKCLYLVILVDIYTNRTWKVLQ